MAVGCVGGGIWDTLGVLDFGLAANFGTSICFFCGKHMRRCSDMLENLLAHACGDAQICLKIKNHSTEI